MRRKPKRGKKDQRAKVIASPVKHSQFFVNCARNFIEKSSRAEIRGINRRLNSGESLVDFLAVREMSGLRKGFSHVEK